MAAKMVKYVLYCVYWTRQPGLSDFFLLYACSGWLADYERSPRLELVALASSEAGWSGLCTALNCPTITGSMQSICSGDPSSPTLLCSLIQSIPGF